MAAAMKIQRAVISVFLGLVGASSAQGVGESSLDVRRLMTAQEFQEAGLSKLSAPEVTALNGWLNRFTSQFYRTSQSSTGGCASAIETQIDGSFEGWSGETIFKLMNGQIWQQSTYSYTYHYSYSPRVTIFPAGGGCKMQVDGMSDAIPVRRIK
jgi:hypothetical protein